MTIKYESIPDDIAEFVRNNHCEECRAGRARCETDNEKSCTSFMAECDRLIEEEKDQAHADMQETECRLTRDMVNDWRRANP